MAEKEAKADLAFKVFDKNHDGYITKEEMLKTSKNLTKKQVRNSSITILKVHSWGFCYLPHSLESISNSFLSYRFKPFLS